MREPRPSVVLSVRVPAVVADALATQLPPEHSSVNAWVSELLHAAIDHDRLSAADRFEWACTAHPQQRLGRKARKPRNQSGK